jgi:hypothetical protein
MKGWLYGLFLLVVLGLLTFVVYDLLFSPPTLQEGTITELVNVPSKMVSTYTPHRGRRIGDHAISVEREEQWIAIVDHDTEGPIQVHCTREHFDQLKVGDRLPFKKYEGQHFHIRYFAHYEDH